MQLDVLSTPPNDAQFKAPGMQTMDPHRGITIMRSTQHHPESSQIQPHCIVCDRQHAEHDLLCNGGHAAVALVSH